MQSICLDSNQEIETVHKKILKSEIQLLIKMIDLMTDLENSTIHEDQINSIYIFWNKDNTKRLSLSHNRETNLFTITLTTLYKDLRQPNISFALMKSIMLKVIKSIETNQINLLDECLICHGENHDTSFVCENCKTIANLL